MSFFLDDNTARTLPAIPEWDWTGRGEGSWSEVNAQLPLSSSEPGAVDHTGNGRFLKASAVLTPSPNSPQQDLQSHASKALFLPDEHVQSNSSFSLHMIVKNAQHRTSACSSHLYVQPRLHIQGQRLTGALRNLCASRSS